MGLFSTMRDIGWIDRKILPGLGNSDKIYFCPSLVVVTSLDIL
jgi:hypothetical protein